MISNDDLYNTKINCPDRTKLPVEESSMGSGQLFNGVCASSESVMRLFITPRSTSMSSSSRMTSIKMDRIQQLIH
jgi:hypothetical protein